MKTSSAKAKGRRAASSVKGLMLKDQPLLQDEDIVVTSSGDTGEDLKLSPLARSVYPWNIEVKNVERLGIWATIKQVLSHGSYNPLIFFTRNREEMWVCMKADYFMECYHGKKSEAVEKD